MLRTGAKCNSQLRHAVNFRFRAMQRPVTDNGAMGSELWQRLRVARKFKDLTQQEVGDACGVSREAVSQWESEDPAKRRNPGLPRLQAIEKLTGAPLWWLLSDNADLNPGEWATGPDDAAAPLNPAPDAVEIPLFRHRPSGQLIQEAAGEGYSQAGSLLFRPGSLEKKGIPLQFAEVHYASDNAMAPRIGKDDAVLIDVSARDIIDGKLYLVEWADREILRMLFKELDGSVRVVASNSAPEYRERVVRPDDKGFSVLGRVRWVGSWEG